MSAPTEPGQKARKPCRGLLQRRTCLVPTLRGCLFFLLACLAIAVFAVKETHSFLAITDRVPDGALVVEGWAPDYALQETIAEFKRGHYGKLFVTGGPLEKGAPLSEYHTVAEFGAATLLRMGLDTNAVQAVPAPRVRKDRTYVSALALRDWFREHQLEVTNLNVVTVGAHARRTRLLFERAFGKGSNVGIIALEDQDYDPNRWWKSSEGFRVVTGEIVAYCYARLLFSPGEP